jgi:DNA-binding NarL/FixJ family response regulator
MIQIVLADDHQVVLEGFKMVLGAEPDFQVVGEATDGLGVGPLIEKVKPDVLVVDLMMPGIGGLEVVRQIHNKHPDIRIAVLSMHNNEAYVVEALRNGASAYVLKQAPGRALVEAIRAIAAGNRYLSPPLSEQKIAEYELRTRAATVDPYDTLSTREREVLQLAAEGLTNAEIGDRLSIGKRTVETHRANLIRKLDLKSQADLVKFAVRRGLVEQ